MNTEPIKNCPKCQAPVPPEAPQGLCPKCLLAAVSVGTEPGIPPESQPPPSPEAIRSLFPQLEVLEFIGQGGMGQVFKARQRHLERLVALKLLPQRPGVDPSVVERFNREARVLARLGHPNIVAVHDFGRVEGFFYLLMEFVDGVNLRQAMRAGKFTPQQALALVPKICDALQYAHEEGVLHRDIKPENLLLDTRGRIKIADFGIAKLLGEAKDVTLTASGAAIGTPHYMAPEQLERPQDVDQRADIFSLGVVFYEMLTGELPIGRFAPPSEKAPVDIRVDQVVLRALEKERERRFQSAGEVKTRVENITANPAQPAPLAIPENPTATDPRAPYSAETWPMEGCSQVSKRRTVVSALLVGLSLVGFLLGCLILTAGHAPPAGGAVLLLFGAIPGFAGTFLGWSLLGKAARLSPASRHLWLIRISALLWPLLVCDAALFLTILLAARNIEVHVLRTSNPALLVLSSVAGMAAIAALNWSVLREWVKRWRSEPTANPFGDIWSHLRGLPRGVLVGAGPVALIVFLLLIRGAFRYESHFQPVEPMPLAQPDPPPGYAVPVGLIPGDNWIHRSGFTVPPGYVLTLTATIWSNQLPIKPGEPNSVFMMGPAGAETHGQLIWKLIGNAALADGAPLEFSTHSDGTDEADSPTFHLVTPQAVAVNWVSEPPQLWPPQNGHTRFLLVKGNSAESGSTPPLPAESEPVVPTPPQNGGADSTSEWAIGIEARVDPIPPNWLHQLTKPQLGLGTNWAAFFKQAESAQLDSLKESKSSNP